MDNTDYKEWDFYHLVQPYFFAHYHFYSRKIEALRKSNINAKLLSFVDKSMYENNISRYNDIEKDGLIELVVVSKKRFLIFSILFFTIGKILKNKKIAFHVLKVNILILYLIKYLPFFKSRIIIIQEFEGDAASEFLYTNEYVECPRPPEAPSGLLSKLKYFKLIHFDKLRVNLADGLILMSQEHIDLWCKINKKIIKSLILPTLPEKERVYFDSEARESIRSKLCLREKTVIIYVGNVVCKWQRLDAMCRFVYKLHDINNSIVFFLLVREEDFSIAREALDRYGISEITILDNVSSGAIHKYMSAADIAVFLRHNHTMNSVVTSGKLGEYLATGLSVITTGANASILNEYMNERNISIKINDDLHLTNDIAERVSNKKLHLTNERSFLQSDFYENFDMNQALYLDYPAFVKGLIYDK